MSSEIFSVKDEYDKEFIFLLQKLENNSIGFLKKDLLLIDAWCKRFCEVTSNLDWKKNRNLHAIFLLDMVLNNKLEEPYSKLPKFETLPLLSKSIVKSRLSNKIKTIDFTEQQQQIKENNTNKSLNNKAKAITQKSIRRNPKDQQIKRPASTNTIQRPLSSTKISNNTGQSLNQYKSKQISNKIVSNEQQAMNYTNLIKDLKIELNNKYIQNEKIDKEIEMLHERIKQTRDYLENLVLNN